MSAFIEEERDLDYLPAEEPIERNEIAVGLEFTLNDRDLDGTRVHSQLEVD